MKTCLIGNTGFVGGNLANQYGFADTFNSENIQDLKGKEYELIVCAGAPGAKWKANKEPEKDLASIQLLIRMLNSVSAQHFILISTVDVYASPLGINEDTEIDIEALDPYGRHRRLLEIHVEQRFDHMILRLPGLFGPGLKKNIIFDFLNENQLEAVCPDSVFQFYDLGNLWTDIGRARKLDIPLINFATEGTSVKEIASFAFGFEFENPLDLRPARYDFRTKYDSALGGSGGYLYNKYQVMQSMKKFVTLTREQI